MRRVHKPSVGLVVVRVVIVTVLATLLAFAIALFFGIVGIVLVDMIRGGGVNLANAYRHVALPVALIVLVIAFLVSLVTEIRSYQRARAAARNYPRAA